MAEKGKIWETQCALFGGDEIFERFNDDNLTIGDDDAAFILEQFFNEGKTAPFELLYKLAGQMAVYTNEGLIGKKTTFGDPERYRDLAQYAAEGKLKWLQNTLGNLIDELTGIGQIWHRKFQLCRLDDAKFLFTLNHDFYQKILPHEKKIREEFFTKLIGFHIQAVTINKIREYIRQEQQQTTRFQFFETGLSVKKLIAIKKVLVDCKGGKYGRDAHYLTPISDDDWLYIFGLADVSNPMPPRWKGSKQSLISTMQTICGKGATLKPLIEHYFDVHDLPPADTRMLPKSLKVALEAIIT